MATIKILLTMISTALLLVSCFKKVPLTTDYGSFSFTSVHWFENEQTAYLFFSIDEFPERLQNSMFQVAYTHRNQNGGTNTVPYEVIDFTQGIHQHHLTPCGQNKQCGSFSWVVPGAVESLQLRLLYDKDSPLSLSEVSPAIQNHSNDGSVNSFSALPFAVFNKENNRIQFRVFHNFGSPASDDVKQYGMQRHFAIKDAYLDNSQTIDSLNDIITSNGYLFPATFCNERNSKNPTVIANKEEYWLNEIFSEESPDIGACLEVDFLDKNNQTILSDYTYGLRNPVVGENGLVLQTPLQSAIQIPLVITACSGDFSSSLTDPDFLAYQDHIMGFIDSETDVCFNINDQDSFRNELRTYLQTTLNQTKLANNPSKQDYIFAVIFNENLNQDFYSIHDIVAEELYRVAEAEASFNSPKLVGSFVYGSTANYSPSLIQSQSILWCPQNMPEELLEEAVSFANPNCTISSGAELRILGINFVSPLGPFPDLENYKEYVEEYGDTGLAKDPKLVLQTVPSGPNTLIENTKQVTYFDNVRITINEDEAIKVCYEKEGSDILYDMRFRPNTLPGISDGLRIEEVEALWNSNSPEGNYRIGIKWDFPFWGGISYESQLAADVISVIPVFNRIKNFDSLGDDIWTQPQWNIGKYLYQCRKYCSHPFFDVNGSYRNNGVWKLNSNNRCESGTHPVWRQETS